MKKRTCTGQGRTLQTLLTLLLSCYLHCSVHHFWEYKNVNLGPFLMQRCRLGNKDHLFMQRSSTERKPSPWHDACHPNHLPPVYPVGNGMETVDSTVHSTTHRLHLAVVIHKEMGLPYFPPPPGAAITLASIPFVFTLSKRLLVGELEQCLLHFVRSSLVSK